MPLQDSYPVLLAQANSLQERGMPDEAFEIYRRILTRLSKLSALTLQTREELRTMLVQAGTAAIAIPRGRGDTETSLEMLELVNQSLPELSEVLTLMRAQIHADAGRVDEAMAQLQAGIDRSEISLNERLDYALEALWNERAEDALSFLEPVDTDAILAAAPEVEEQSDDDDEDDDEDDEDDSQLIPQVWFVRFRALAMLGWLDEAEEAWNQARLASPDDPPTGMEIVEMFLKHGNQEKALHYADMDVNSSLRGLLRGVVAAKSGKQEWARDEWWRVTREAFDIESDGFPAWVECALRQDDLTKAETAISAGLEKNPRSARLLLYRGIRLAQNGELERAMEHFTHIAFVNRASKFSRRQFVFESDRWLVEQAISDPELQQTVLDALFSPVMEEPTADEPPADETEMGEE